METCIIEDIIGPYITECYEVSENEGKLSWE